MSSDPQPAPFDRFYYRHACGEPYARNDVWLGFFGGIAERIVADIRPARVLDAGCAMGFLVECLRQRGVKAYGVDISEYAIRSVHASVRDFCQVGSITAPLERRYDLIVSIEVLEHMPRAEAEQAIANLCRHTDDVLFSSTPYDYKEATHENVQPPEYWAEQFARQGFIRDVEYDASYITPWAVRYRRSTEPLHRVVRSYERGFALLTKEVGDLRALVIEMRGQLSAGDEREHALQAELAAGQEQAASLLDAVETIRQTRTWRLAERLQRLRASLAPAGSRRERVLDWLIARLL